MSEAEDYFLSQLQVRLFLAGEAPLATGYFRSALRPGIAGFAQATSAKGYFLALTDKQLIIVTTRAPATKSPLLEKEYVERLPRDANLRMSTDGSTMLIQTLGRELHVALWLSHRDFPRQGELIEALSIVHGSGLSLAELRALRRKAFAKIAAWAVVPVVIGVLWALLRR